MRVVSGLVCLGLIKDQRDLAVLYGKSVHLPQVYESVETNGLVVWEQEEEAQQAAAQIRRRSSITQVTLHRLAMQLAETEDELVEFHGQSPLIVIMYGDDELRLFGPMAAGCIRVCDRLASLSENGLKGFERFEEAEYAAREMQRQVQTKVTLATFSLQRL